MVIPHLFASVSWVRRLGTVQICAKNLHWGWACIAQSMTLNKKAVFVQALILPDPVITETLRSLKAAESLNR